MAGCFGRYGADRLKVHDFRLNIQPVAPCRFRAAGGRAVLLTGHFVVTNLLKKNFFHYLTCAIGTGITALGLINRVLSIRGACTYIKSFHFGGTVLTALAAPLLFAALDRKLPKLQSARTFWRATLFLALIYCLWAVAVPLSEASARLVERIAWSREQLGDVGFGWFYWDDSGMGADPTTFLYLLIVGSMLAPWIFFLIPAVVYGFFFSVARPRECFPYKISEQAHGADGGNAGS